MSFLSNYYLPPEWEPHLAVWLAWPYDKISFGSLNEKDNKIDPERLPKVEAVFLDILKALTTSEQVNLIVRNKTKYQNIPEGVRIYEADYADVWTRDYMPLFVKDKQGHLTAVKWNYDAYGEQFVELLKDNKVWPQVNQELKIKTVEPGILLEGGSIEQNGSGTILTTEQCLLKRNPKISKADYEDIFGKYLGVTKVIWLKEGLTNDHTDGHIDEIAKFVAPNKIVCAYEDDPSDENYRILDENYRVLKNAVDNKGKPFEVVKLPMPHMCYHNGEKAPVSYANFFIGNKVVLVPAYNDPNDAKALETIQSCFPDRKAISIDCSEIIYGGGAIHCMTQQVPAA